MHEIAIVTDKLPDGKIGVPYYASLAIDVFPKTDLIEWECQNRLPKGLELNSRTGVLSGNATESFMGTITVWARRTDVNMSCYKRFLLTISQGESEKPAGELRIQEVENSELKLGVNCSIPLKAQGGMPPYKWKVENLPIGMRLVDGQIIGVPAMAGGNFPLEISMEDREGQTCRYFCWLHIAD